LFAGWGKWRAYVHHSGQGVNDIVLVLNIVARNIVGNVCEKLREVRNLKEFIRSNELQSLDTAGFQRGGKSSIRESSASQLVDLGQSGLVERWEAIGQWVREWSSGSNASYG